LQPFKLSPGLPLPLYGRICILLVLDTPLLILLGQEYLYSILLMHPVKLLDMLFGLVFQLLEQLTDTLLVDFVEVGIAAFCDFWLLNL
jgi:hypothetical protein